MSKTIIAIDPGTTQSAVIIYQTDINKLQFFIKSNNEILIWLNSAKMECGFSNQILVIEMIASYGMPVGKEIFETCVWIGRFIESWKGAYKLVYRREVKLSLCGTSKANDGNIRQRIIDIFGGKEKAIGNKKNPGILYGVKADMWQSLALAIYYKELDKESVI